MEFMRTAEVVNERPIGIGINHSVKVTLEQDGVQSHAIFREVDVRRSITSINDVQYQFFADSYLFECAAYELATMIDMTRVPPPRSCAPSASAAAVFKSGSKIRSMKRATRSSLRHL